MNRVPNKPNKTLLIVSIVGLVIFIPAAIAIIVLDSQNGSVNAGVFILLIVDIVNIIAYLVSNSKYRKFASEQAEIQEKSQKLTSPARITVSRGTNEGMQSSLELQICNNGRFVANLSVGKSISFQTDISTNVLTTAYLHPLNKGQEIPIKAKITLELSDDEEANVFFEKKKFSRT